MPGLAQLYRTSDQMVQKDVQLSMELQDLVQRMMAKPPRTPLTLDDVLVHPWVTKKQLTTSQRFRFYAQNRVKYTTSQNPIYTGQFFKIYTVYNRDYAPVAAIKKIANSVWGSTGHCHSQHIGNSFRLWQFSSAV